MVKVPSDSFFNAFLELEGGLPAEFILQLGRVDGISEIMSCAVLDEGDEREAMAFGMPEDAVDRIDHDFDQVDVLPFVESADIVCLTDFSFMEYKIYGTCMVFHIEPITDIFSFTIDRKWFSVPDIIDKERNKLLRELIRAIVVRAVGNDCRHTICVVEGADEVV